VQAIDDWNRNWKLACVFEAQVGTGRLLVCSLDLTRDLDKRPVARQLRASLLAYADSKAFTPTASLTAEQLRGLWFDTRVMAKLGAKAEAPGGSDAKAVLDGDPNTCWTAGGGKSSARHPYALTIAFPAPVSFDGLELMTRQNDRDHFGDIRGYMLEASDDGQTWRTLLAGELASTWKPQTLKLPQPATARHLRLTAHSGFGADNSVALAEFAVRYTGPALPDNSNADIRYQRARSTSTDVDEGVDPAQPKAKIH